MVSRYNMLKCNINDTLLHSQVDLTLSDSDDDQQSANQTPIRSQPATPAINPRVNSNGAACSRPTSGGKPNGMFNMLMNSNYFD